MIYELQAPADLGSFPDIFGGLPPRILGLLIWMVVALVAIAYVLVAKPKTPRRSKTVSDPMLLAAGICVGMFICTYDLVDEVSINLKHAYNLYHYGKFSMSPERWIEGTVEAVYYLLHVPFAWSQHSLVVANYLISLLVALLHLPLAGYALDPEASPGKKTLQLCGFALCLPLASTFSSGFGNSLVSLVFLAAIASALNGRETRSLVLSGLLPLFRPDAILLSVANAGVIAVSRRLSGKPLLSVKEHGLPLLVPVLSAGIYYSSYRAVFGNWVPTPIFFKSIHLPMLAMTYKALALRDMVLYFSQGAHAIALACILLLSADFLRRRPGASALLADHRVLTLGLYSLATMPLMLFYSIARNTVQDFSFGTYSRYWVAFDLSLQLLVLAMLAKVDLQWGTRKDNPEPEHVAWKQNFALACFLFLSMMFTLGGMNGSLLRKPGRNDSAYAGAFTERFLPANLTLSSTEMDTFGLMVERPVIDLWGYTNPAIAFSSVCNGDQIRSNGRYFLQVKPDVYWPYWFTTGLREEDRTGNFDNLEESLATFHHTSKKGNHLGDMSQVLAEYDAVVIRTKTNNLAYLIRKNSIKEVVESLTKHGFLIARQRSYDLARFHRIYDKQEQVTYPCL